MFIQKKNGLPDKSLLNENLTIELTKDKIKTEHFLLMLVIKMFGLTNRIFCNNASNEWI